MELPLRKARAVDPSEDAFNGSIEEGRRQAALAARRQCYDVVTNALRSLKGQATGEMGSTKVSFSGSAPGARLLLDEAARESYIRQIVQLSVRWPDNAFHECLYQTMIELGLTQELLDLGGPDLVTFLQSAGNYQTTKVRIGSATGGWGDLLWSSQALGEDGWSGLLCQGVAAGSFGSGVGFEDCDMACADVVRASFSLTVELCIAGKPGDGRDIQVADAFNGTEQQPIAAADFGGAGEVPGAVVSSVRSQAAARAGGPCVTAAGRTEAAGGRVGDHAGTEVGCPASRRERERGGVGLAVRWCGWRVLVW